MRSPRDPGDLFTRGHRRCLRPTPVLLNYTRGNWVTSTTSHDAGKHDIRSIDSIQNHPIRLGEQPATINSKLSSYFSNVRSFSLFLDPSSLYEFLFLVEFARATCLTVSFPFCYRSGRFTCDSGSNDTTASWRSPGSRSKSTKRIR